MRNTSFNQNNSNKNDNNIDNNSNKNNNINDNNDGDNNDSDDNNDGSDNNGEITAKPKHKKEKKYALNESEQSNLLQSQLIELMGFWLTPHNLLRQAQAVSIVTHSKRKERILCYLGWLKDNMNTKQPDLKVFDVAECELQKNLYEKYISYLQNDRKLGKGTIVGKKKTPKKKTQSFRFIFFV